MSHEATVRQIAEEIAALRSRFPQLRGFDPTSASAMRIYYRHGVSEVANPHYERLLAEQEAEDRAYGPRKRPLLHATIPQFASDGIELMIDFMLEKHAAMSAAARPPGSNRIGDLVYDLRIEGPNTAELAELHRAVYEILRSHES
jgi:hypothetical protein